MGTPSTASNLPSGDEVVKVLESHSSWSIEILLRAFVLLIVGFSLWRYQYESLFSVIVLFVLVVPMEKIFPRHKGQAIRRPKWKLDLTYALASPLLNALGAVIFVVIAVLSFAWVPGLLVRPLVEMIPASFKAIVAFVLFDFFVYWAHRWYHEVPELWRFHSIHHSPEHLDWISGFRIHPFDFALIAPGFIFLVAAGFDPETSGIIAVIQLISGIFLHANISWRLRPFHSIIQTPEFHHWHHANDEDAHWSNYCGFLPFWDILFGTYYMPKDRRPEEYGVDEYIPEGLLKQLHHPLKGTGNPIRAVFHPIRSIRTGFSVAKKILRGVWRSTFRPRGHRPPSESDGQSQLATSHEAEGQ